MQEPKQQAESKSIAVSKTRCSECCTPFRDCTLSAREHRRDRRGDRSRSGSHRSRSVARNRESRCMPGCLMLQFDLLLDRVCAVRQQCKRGRGNRHKVPDSSWQNRDPPKVSLHLERAPCQRERRHRRLRQTVCLLCCHLQLVRYWPANEFICRLSIIRIDV